MLVAARFFELAAIAGNHNIIKRLCQRLANGQCVQLLTVSSELCFHTVGFFMTKTKGK